MRLCTMAVILNKNMLTCIRQDVRTSIFSFVYVFPVVSYLSPLPSKYIGRMLDVLVLP